MRRTVLSLAAVLCLPACMKGAPAMSEGYAARGDAATAPMVSSEAARGDDGGGVAMDDMEIAGDEDEPDGFDRNVQAGTLTAGVFDDTRNPAVFTAFAEKMQQSDVHSVANLMAMPLTTLQIEGIDGAPIGGASVRIGNRTLVSGTDGRVVVTGWDLGRTQSSAVDVGVRFGNASTKTKLELGTHDNVVALQAVGHAPRALDIALVVDATGSMGDELEYLKVELRSIARDVKRAFPNVDQRFALVVYRDQGDQYVTRTFDFTADLAKFERRLGRQQAEGGGDYPEAMDAAMMDAGALSWRGPETAKLAFVVADAPPHANRAMATLEAADELRTQGVAMYPIAASGVAESAELVMRSAAVMSGGEYLFVTDDSGVGNSHAEPHIPCYAVQSLRASMARVIRSELAGKRIEADPRHTIREVGRSSDGVCETPSLTLAK